MGKKTNLVKHGIVIAVPHSVNYRPCCPLHGIPYHTASDVRGYESWFEHDQDGPWWVFEKGTAPRRIDVAARIQTFEFQCRYNHPLWYKAWDRLMFVPCESRVPPFYKPEPGEEFYPMVARLRRLQPRLAASLNPELRRLHHALT